MQRRKLNIESFLLKCIIIQSVVIQFSCEDPLPPYVNPGNILNATVNFVYEPLVIYRYVDFNYFLPTLRYSTPSFIINIGVINKFDETLQDNIYIDGKVEIWISDRPDDKVTITINEYSINSSLVDPQTNILTLNPEDTLWLRVNWGYALDDGMPAFTRMQYIESHIPNSSSLRHFHPEVFFTSRATVQIFKGVTPVRSTEKKFLLSFQGTIAPPP